MNQATELDPARGARGAGLKFVYANGARPLAGYTIKRGVGRGGFGEVYYAVSDAGKEVALKLIRRNLDVELRGVTHCLNLKHPNLLSVFDVRQDDEQNSWVVMEYVSGESLEEAIERHRHGMPVEELLQWMQGIAAGVAYLHDHGIVHRDLKPGNIFLDEGVVKLGDYGLSKFISCSRRSGQTESVGTVHYMAPEVANGRYGKEIDVYALGIILYEMLTGRVPFEGESVGEVLMKHLTAEPDLSSLREPFRTAVGRALAKDPAVRTRSVAELMAMLPAPTGPPRMAPLVQQFGAPSPRRAHTEPGDRTAEADGAPPPPPRPPLIPLAQSSEEPIARALRDWGRKASNAWHDQNLTTPVKVALIILGIWLLGTNAPWIIPTAGTLLVVYAGYRLVRAVVLHGKMRHQQRSAALGMPMATAAAELATAAAELLGASPTASAAATESPPPPPPAQNPRRFGRRPWRAPQEPVLPRKPMRERATDLLGSLLLSACVVAALGVIMLLLQGEPPRAEQYAWLVLTSAAASWLILIPAKLWEGREGEAVLRRFAMMVLGMGLGGGTYLLSDVLLVRLAPATHGPPLRSLLQEFDLAPHNWTNQFHNSDGSPTIYAFLAFFAFLFLLVRWWRQADPLRSSRFSLFATAWSVAVAWFASQLWVFPANWSMMVAATASIAVQLTSPWVPSEQRQFATA